MLLDISSRKKSLRTRLLFWVWFVSSLATFIFTTIQLLSDYHRETNLALNQIAVIQKNHIPSINKSLWDYNLDYLNLQLKGLKELSYVKAVRVVSEDFSTEGDLREQEGLQVEEIPLSYNKQNIGVLEVGLDIRGIQKSYLLKIIYIFIQQALKTLIVCFLLLKIFDKVIMRHLGKLVTFLSDFSLSDEKVLKFDRDENINDELTLLEQSINKLKKELSTTGQRLLELNQDLENKVIERTKLLDEERSRSMQSAKLASLGEMAGGIAHEINNPLAIISSTMQFLRKSIDRKRLTETLLIDSIQTVEGTVERTSKIITGLKTVSRSSEGFDKRDVLIRDIFEDVLSLCSEKFRNNGISIQIELGSPAFDKIIRCDRVQLSQVILNLLSNAFDAVQEVQNKWVHIELDEDHNYHQIMVSDSGSGIPEAIVEKIFNPFFTSKEVGKGTGLGLSISKSIMEKHGGAIELDRTTGETCFILKLPK